MNIGKQELRSLADFRRSAVNSISRTIYRAAAGLTVLACAAGAAHVRAQERYLTGGTLFNSGTLTATAAPNADGNVKIGNPYVPAFGGASPAKASFPHVMPYFDGGYGHKKPTLGIGFTFDLGVVYGHPHVTYGALEIYQLFVGPDDIQDEEQTLAEKTDKYRWYRVAQAAMTYRI